MLKNRILMLCIIIASGILVSYRGGVITYSLFSLSLLLPLLSALYLFYVYFRFRIYQFIDHKTIVKCERVPYFFTLANEDFLTYSNVRVTFLTSNSVYDHVDSDKNYCLTAGDRIDHETMIACRYRGEYSIGIDKVIIRDYLNLFHVTYSCPSKINVQVLPRIIHLEQLSIAPIQEDVKNLRRVSMSASMIPDNEVRKYTPGDSIRRIHWKASARTQELLIRNYTDEPKPSMALFLNLNLNTEFVQDRIVLSDKIIECALAITDYLLGHKTICSVFYDSGTFTQQNIKDKADFESFYRLCSGIPFRSNESIGELLTNGISYLEGSAYCMIITSTLDKELSLACFEALEYGHSITLLYIGDKELAMRESFDERIHFFQIRPDQEVADVLG